MKALSGAALAVFLLSLIGCGGSTSRPTGGPLTGNWQINLTQEFPRPQTALSVSGFLNQSSDTLTGSVQVPPSSQNGRCAGVGSVTGSVTGQAATLSIDVGGTTINFNGTVSSDGQWMSGNDSGLAGSCYIQPTTGTWTATLVRPISGNFTGTLASSQYMQVFAGIIPPAPVMVSGTLTQQASAGASTATLTGTITAESYPCFRTATLTGTISGQNVLLSVFGFDGNLIGQIGRTSAPATVMPITNSTTGASGTAVVATIQNGLQLGDPGSNPPSGPCPPVFDSGGGVHLTDNTAVELDLQ